MSADAANAAANRQYRRELGLWSVVFLATGAILGPAVGFTPVSVLALAGPSGIISWIVAFLLILAVAMSYVELGTMWPRAGGVAYYPARSSGPVVGVLNAWGSFIGYALAVPSIVVAFVEYLTYWFPSLYTGTKLTTAGIIASLLTLVAVAVINWLRIRYVGQINNVLTVATIAGLLVMIIALFTSFHPRNFSHFGGFTPFGSSGLFLAVSATIYGYGGFRQPIDYAEEVRDPGRTIPKAVGLTLVITMALYLLESLSFTGAVSWHGLGLKPGDWAGLNSLARPLVSVSDQAGLAAIGLIALLATLIASFKDGYIYYGGCARVGHTLARYDRYLPPVFTRMSPGGVPAASNILVLIISAVYIVLLPAFSSLFPLVASALLLSYAPGPLALAIFRRKNPGEPRPYRLPACQVLAPWAFVVSSVLIFWAGWHSVRVLIPSVAVGLLLLFFYHPHRKITAADVKWGIWLPLYLGAVAVLSYLGSTEFGGSGVIPFPWDTVVFAVMSVIFYFAGYYCGLRYPGNAVFEEEERPEVGMAAEGA
jgi:amino acid transporter